MSFDEFERASQAELRQWAKARFDIGAAISTNQPEKAVGYLLEAQFYVAEIDRRHDTMWIRISFICKLVIILLIAIEIAISLLKH